VNGEKDDQSNHEEIDAQVEELADDLNRIQALVSGSYAVSFGFTVLRKIECVLNFMTCAKISLSILEVQP
jgi:hypothetical protein